MKQNTENFYNLRVSILERSVGDIGDNIIENLKFIFIKKLYFTKKC